MSKKSAQVIAYGATAKDVKNFSVIKDRVYALTGIEIEGRHGEICFDATLAQANKVLEKIRKAFSDARVVPGAIRLQGRSYLFLKTEEEPCIEIEVCQRLMDRHLVPEFKGGKYIRHVEAPKYHAQIKGEPGVWAAGTSVNDAIGDLVRCHPDRFGVKITALGKLAR